MLTCDWKLGGGRCCGAPLDERRDVVTGQLTFGCALCDRRRAGLCRDCPRPVDGTTGKALRCATCRRRKQLLDGAHWRARDPVHARAIHRAIGRRYRDRKRGGPPTPKDERYRHILARRAAALTPARRSEIARHASLARWTRERDRQARRATIARLQEAA